MKYLWLLSTAIGLFLFLGSAGAVEMGTISLLPLLLQIAAGCVFLFLGQWLRKSTEARSARKKASALQKKAGAQTPAQSKNRPCHRAA